MAPSPIVATIVVTHQTARGVLAKVDGQPRLFPKLEDVFRVAVQRLDGEMDPTPPRCVAK